MSESTTPEELVVSIEEVQADYVFDLTTNKWRSRADAARAAVMAEREAVRGVFTGEASYDAEVLGFLEKMWAERDGGGHGA